MPAADLSVLATSVLATAPGELYPPAQYRGWWLLLAIAILIAIVAVVTVILLVTRAPKPAPRPAAPAPRRQPMTAEGLRELRGDYMERIDAVEQAYSEGGMNARQANAELSRITREFVNEYTGLAAPVMSLEELEAHDVHPALIDAVKRHYYPSLFRGAEIIDPVAGARAAREVVSAWH